jgi:hypothetical protein
MTAAPFLALAAALEFAVARVVLKRALPHTTPLTGVVVLDHLHWNCAVDRRSPHDPTGRVRHDRSLAVRDRRLLAPGLGRLLVYVGIDRIGAARSSAVMIIDVRRRLAICGRLPG